MLKKLPVSTYTFRDIIKHDCLYVDKTPYIYNLIRYPKSSYFLSRPRRFGKSLLISTLAEIFKGNKDLFQDLWIYQNDYIWETHPVIRLDFSQERVYTAAELQEVITEYLYEIATRYSITLQKAPYHRLFRRLIQGLAEGQRSVVILIDEYDKPILDNIDNLEEAILIRETLKNFYAVIKAMDQHLHLTFITGISKFSQVGVFSTLNNLVDLTMNTQFSAMLGLTQEEVNRDFADYIRAFAEQQGQTIASFLDEMQLWYDGFCFAPQGQNVYNPYSVIHLFYHQQFSNYWFETGTPTFLIKLIRDRNYELQQFEELVLHEIDFKTYELESLEIVPLLFQTGYLTIRGYVREPRREAVYTLAYPNYEVERAFLTYLLNAFSYVERTRARSYLHRLIAAIQASDLGQTFEIMSAFFANIPYDLQLKYEKYYQSLFYVIFMMLGMEIEVEVETNAGRIDAVVALNDEILLFEFKIDKTAQEALQQIKDNKYYQKYRLHHKKMTLVGANFNSQTRCVDEWDSEMVA